jgi:hypothetical protein
MKLLSPEDVLRLVEPLMADFGAPWAIAGGWALDLYLGRATREHADIELAIFRQDQSNLRQHLREWTFDKVVEGRRQPWWEVEWLALPIHELHAHPQSDPSHSIEFLLNERTADDWIFRRNPAITLPLDRAIVHAQVGLPVLAPEIVLLFKAKSPAPKDEADFRFAYPALDHPRRRWLRAALKLCHPSHPWIEFLRPPNKS